MENEMAHYRKENKTLKRYRTRIADNLVKEHGLKGF
jgi:hypothetical protein